MTQMSNKSVHIHCENIDSPIWLNNTDFSIRQSFDLWKISIKDLLHELDQLQQVLSVEEKSRVERYHQKKDKIRFTIGRGMLRFILAKYLNVFPSSLTFKQGHYNKPYLDRPDFHFNVSYAEDLIVIGVAFEEIGVDIEYISHTLNYNELAEEVFTQAERNFIASSSKGREYFFKLWTRKEALLKGVSRGLGDDLKNFSCLDGLQPGNELAILKDDWRIQSFLLDTHYYVSMAFQQTSSIRYYNSQSIFPPAR